MLKRTELFFSVLLVPVDFCLLLLSAWLAYRLRFQAVITDIRPVLYDISPLVFFRSAVLVAAGWLAIFAVLGLYTRRVTDPWWSEAGKVIIACSTGLVAVIVTVFLRRELLSSRFIIVAAWVLSIVLVTAGRLIVRAVQHLLFRFGYGAHRVAVIGVNKAANEAVVTMKRYPGLGYAVAVQLPSAESSIAELDGLARARALDEILLVDPRGSSEARQLFFDYAEDHHLSFRYAPDILLSPVGELTVDLELGVPIIEVPETTLRGWGRVLKRMFDILGSAVGLVIFLPLLLIIALVIKLDSPGPIVYKNKRLGRNRLFTLYKFRTMKREHCVGEQYGGAAAEQYYQALVAKRNTRRGPVPKILNDPRVTRVGRWLRRFSLDELLQLYNVLMGDMSLVGPRPHYPAEVANYEKHHRKVLAIKPGLTGLAQVKGRSDLDFEDEVRLDRFYIEHWSLLLDLRIILRTIIAIFEKRNTL